MIFLIATAAVFFTLLGGLFAIRFRDKLHLILGFSAGAVIGVAFFDLLPESLEISNKFFDIRVITSFVALGFLIYLILDRLVLFHSHGEANSDNDEESGQARGILGASSLSFHSLLDGIAVGVAFQVSTAIGVIVAVAVLIHDFSDGINTVNLIFKNGGNKNQAFKWLAVDAVAPALGIFLTFIFSISEKTLGVLLAIFTGFFIYIGASELLPESHHAHPKILTTIMTLLGVAVLYLAIQIAGI